jgi:hypothetical protein
VAEQATSIVTPVTLDAMVGVIVTQALDTDSAAIAAYANKQFTLTNSFITADSVVFVSAAYDGAGVPVVSFDLGDGSATVTITNVHNATACAGVLKIFFQILPTKPE